MCDSSRCARESKKPHETKWKCVENVGGVFREGYGDAGMHIGASPTR